MTLEISTYQNQHNLYGTGNNGMQGYFEHLRNQLGQSYFDQLVAFFTQNSSLYIDSLYLNEWHIYGSSRIGVYEVNIPIACVNARDENENGIFEPEEYLTTTLSEHTMLFGSYENYRGYKRYEFSNHLGNVLLTISDKKTQTCGQEITWNVEVISATDYSPFGAPLPGRTWNANAYRFGFSGKEVDDEIKGNGNSYDFGERMLDARLGRWLSIDKLFYKYPSLSSYAYVANMPLIAIDPDGRDIVILIAREGAACMGHMAALIQDKSGNWYYMTQGAAENGGISKMMSAGVNGGVALEPLNTKDVDVAIQRAKQDVYNSPYTEQIQFTTSESQDEQIFQAATEMKDATNSGEKKYNLLFNNCVDACQDPIEKGTGVDLPLDFNPKPNSYFDKLMGNKDKIQSDINKNVPLKDKVKFTPPELDDSTINETPDELKEN